MKWWGYCAVALALTAWLGLPFSEYETESLLPVRTVQVERTAQGIHVVSEVGEGIGETWEAALEDLRAKAEGTVFFDTAEHLVLLDWSLLPEILASKVLRPAAQVHRETVLQATEKLYELLHAHPTNITIGELEEGEDEPEQ